MGVYCNAEVRPLLRYLWALAFLPPEDVLEAYEGLVVSLNALVARDVISQADVQRLNGRIPAPRLPLPNALYFVFRVHPRLL